MKTLLSGLIRFYRKWISPMKPPVCRFYPSCSQYALEAVEIHGAWKGSLLAVRRIVKCHPFHPGGYDPVPPKAASRGRGQARLSSRRGTGRQK